MTWPAGELRRVHAGFGQRCRGQAPLRCAHDMIGGLASRFAAQRLFGDLTFAVCRWNRQCSVGGQLEQVLS